MSTTSPTTSPGFCTRCGEGVGHTPSWLAALVGKGGAHPAMMPFHSPQSPRPDRTYFTVTLTVSEPQNTKLAAPLKPLPGV